MDSMKVCIVGSGDVGKGLVVHFIHRGIDVVFVGSNPKAPEKTVYFGEEVVAKDLKKHCICSSYEDMHKQHFSHMVITYPHMAIPDRFPELFAKPLPSSCKSIYFMFAFGDAMLSIPKWVNKIDTAAWIIGNFSLLHAKTTPEGVNNVTKVMPGQYYSFETAPGMPATAEFMSTMTRAGFDLNPTPRAMDIFLNCAAYSNMVWHPCLWLVRFQQGLECSHSIDGDKDWKLYGTVSTASWNRIYGIFSDVKKLGNAVDGLGNLSQDLPIHALVKAGGFPEIGIVDKILELHVNTRKWPFLSKFYKGDHKVKTKHFQRDVCHGLNMCRHLARHLNVDVPHIQVLCDTYRGLTCFKDSELWNLYDQTDFGEVVEDLRAVEQTKLKLSNMDRDSTSSQDLPRGIFTVLMLILALAVFVRGFMEMSAAVGVR